MRVSGLSIILTAIFLSGSSVFAANDNSTQMATGALDALKSDVGNTTDGGDGGDVKNALDKVVSEGHNETAGEVGGDKEHDHDHADHSPDKAAEPTEMGDTTTPVPLENQDNSTTTA